MLSLEGTYPPAYQLALDMLKVKLTDDGDGDCDGNNDAWLQ